MTNLIIFYAESRNPAFDHIDVRFFLVEQCHCLRVGNLLEGETVLSWRARELAQGRVPLCSYFIHHIIIPTYHKRISNHPQTTQWKHSAQNNQGQSSCEMDYNQLRMDVKGRAEGSQSTGSKSSLLANHFSQNEDIPPQELSGDENADGSILVASDAFSPVKASIFLSVTILMKTVIGTGILSLPFVFSTLGIIPTLLFFILTGLLMQFTSSLLLKSKNMSGHSNFSSIMQHLHRHRAFKVMVTLFMMSGNLGACILDLMFFKTTVRKILVDVIQDQETLDMFYTSQWMILIVVACAQFPITLLNKIEKLRKMSFLGVVGIAVFITSFMVYYVIEIYKGATLRNMELLPDDWLKAVATIPNFIFSLTFHANFFPIFKGLEESCDQRMKKVVCLGVWTCISWYLILGLLGFSITHDKVISPNFLQQISYADTNGGLFVVMNASFLVSLFFAFSIIFFSCRNNFILIIKILRGQDGRYSKLSLKGQRRSLQQISDYAQQERSRKRRAKLVYIFYTAANFIGIVLIAMFVENIESVFNLVGAVSCSSISIIFPLYFYIRLVQKKSKDKTKMYKISVMLLAIMLPFFIFTVVALYL